ncbi:MAG: carboxypeptidase regulatory-like domain-containing protein [Chloroflexota bacterium]
MKSKHLFQIFVLFAMVFSALGSVQPAYAETEATVVVRELTYWDATFIGYVDASRYEKWPLTLNESHNFTVTATTTTGDLSPLILLLDATGTEIARATGALTSNQPAGNYSVQIQPETGSGFYNLTLRDVEQEPTPTQPSSATVVTPTTVNVGETASVTVDLSNIPAEGYTSAEFICTYNATLAEVSNITTSNLFGEDAAVAINGPQDGKFIVAIAGSNGNKATTGGVAFTFSIKGLQAGQTVIDCKARVSKGDRLLLDVTSTPATLTVNDIVVVQDGTLTGQVLASKAVTVTLYKEDNTSAGSVVANTDGTFSLTAPAGTYTVVAAASGFLNAQGTTTLTAGQTSTMPTVSLPAGDIDGNGVIDQFDAMTIGMSYNTALPAAADLNSDGTINVLDLELLAANYRKSGALAWQ